MTASVLWIDQDANDFDRLRIFFKRHSVECYYAYSIHEAYDILHEAPPTPFGCILLDAFVPIGLACWPFELTANEKAMIGNDLTGHILLRKLSEEFTKIHERTLVLSAYTKEYLVERGFPSELEFFHKEKLANKNWDMLCNRILSLVQGDKR